MTKAISDRRTIAAPPEVIWAILTDTARHSEIDGSSTVKGTRGEGKVLTKVGDTFGMQMKQVLPYPIKNTVVEFEPLRRLAWRHAGRHRWRYELTPVEGGTEVVETFDWSRAPGGFLYGPLGFLKAHRKNIPATLARLDQVATASKR
jgi:uncharacterized protein YndB with AHSA1/START domain